MSSTSSMLITVRRSTTARSDHRLQAPWRQSLADWTRRAAVRLCAAIQPRGRAGVPQVVRGRRASGEAASAALRAT